MFAEFINGEFFIAFVRQVVCLIKNR